MFSKNLLIEGGAAGHMNHLYDNGELTFGKMKEIFRAAAQGKLEGTEKTDGQNLMISYSVKDGRAKGVRNKTEIKGGGLTPEQLAKKFADRGNPALKETFADALRIFEKAVQSLDHKTQEELFGPDTNIYYNAEVMDPRTPNVISYDTKTLVIHRAGHAEFDRVTGERKTVDLTDKAQKLEDIIKDAQDRIKGENYGLQVNAIRKLKALSDEKPLNSAISRLDSVLSSVNYLIGNDNLQLNDNSTINDFMLARVYILMNSVLDKGITQIGKIDARAREAIAKRILGVKGISVNDINKKLSSEQKKYVRDNLLNSTSISSLLKMAIAPVENVVSDFATEVLKGLESAFIIDNSKEVQRLRDEVKTAINAIQSSGNEEAMKILKRQLQKLKSADNVDATAEGFVFDYDGITYKFTGNFAPVNQILGLFKYGRGNVPAMKKESLQEAKKGLADVAVVPGAFKPPHKGHLDMIRQYSELAKKVVVLVSPLPRTLPDGRIVPFEKSKKIFEMFLAKMGLSQKVKILESPKNSPVGATFDFVANENNNPDFAQPGQVVILGTSTKGGDEARFQADASKYAKAGVTVKIVPVKPFESLSATDMRAAIGEGNLKELINFIPDEFGKNKKEVAETIISMFNKEKIKENVIYDIIVETVTKRGNKYCLLSKKTKRNLGCYSSKSGAKNRERQVQYFKHMKEMSAVGAGAVQGAAVVKQDEE
jgi:cytidyltransferase-like protein